MFEMNNVVTMSALLSLLTCALYYYAYRNARESGLVPV